MCDGYTHLYPYLVSVHLNGRLMTRGFRLSVKKPCDQKFDELPSTPNGGFCPSCQQEVTDFTNMTELEILSYFKRNTSKVCGRFLGHQMKTYRLPVASTRHQRWKWLGLGAIGVAALFPLSVFSQHSAAPSTEINASVKSSTTVSNASLPRHIVKGKVVDAYDQTPLPGVNVVLKGSTHGTVTDINGDFTFPIELEKGDILVFSFIGLDTKEYKVSDSDTYIIDIRMVTMTCDIAILGEVAVEEVYSSKKGLWSKVRSLFK